MSSNRDHLRTPRGTYLDLRQRLLYLGQMHRGAAEPLAHLVSWNAKYIHESSHWVRYCGTTAGVLLNLLESVRDRCAASFLQQLSDSDAKRLQRNRLEGTPIFDASAEDGEVNRLGQFGEGMAFRWLCLYKTHGQLLNSIPPASFPTGLGEYVEDVEDALISVWNQCSGTETQTTNGMAQPILTGAIHRYHLDSEAISTKQLLETAGMLDEHEFLVLGALSGVVAARHVSAWNTRFVGSYGAPMRLACQLAGRDLDSPTILGLIDFALNPPVPGLTKDCFSVSWGELDPPTRFVNASRSVRGKSSVLEDEPPSEGAVKAFMDHLERETGFRIGVWEPMNFTPSSLADCAQDSRPITTIGADVVSLYARHLHHLKRKSPEVISHYGRNFAGSGAIHNLDRARDQGDDFTDRWLHPPFRVLDGKFAWPDGRLNYKEAARVLLSTLVSEALDLTVSSTQALDAAEWPVMNDEFLSFAKAGVSQITRQIPNFA